jgi:hypothetical protein
MSSMRFSLRALQSFSDMVLYNEDASVCSKTDGQRSAIDYLFVRKHSLLVPSPATACATWSMHTAGW